MATASFVLANVAGQNSILAFVMQAFSGWGQLLASIAAIGIFIGAYRSVARKTPAAVLAAYLVLLPLPVMIYFCGLIKGIASSLIVISASPQLEVTRSDITGGIAASLVSLLLILLMTAPTYALLAYGLLQGAMNPTGVRETESLATGNSLMTPRPA